jgi:hypothetical protein
MAHPASVVSITVGAALAAKNAKDAKMFQIWKNDIVRECFGSPASFAHFA